VSSFWGQVRTAGETNQNAQNYLQSILHVGESPRDLIERFGPPLGKFETQSNELCLDFHFSDQNQTSAARSAGVRGFAAFFVSNKLVHWDPVYESRSAQFENSSVKHAPFAFKANHAVIMFSVVSQEQRDDEVYVNTPKFPNLGYIKKSPDLAIFSGQYIAYDSTQNATPTIELLLSREDGEKLHTLTSENVGSQMALLVDTQIVLAPYVQGPISDGQVTLELSKPSYSIVLQALKNAHKD
jgi:hypothetical protein